MVLVGDRQAGKQVRRDPCRHRENDRLTVRLLPPIREGERGELAVRHLQGSQPPTEADRRAMRLQ